MISYMLFLQVCKSLRFDIYMFEYKLLVVNDWRIWPGQGQCTVKPRFTAEFGGNETSAVNWGLR